MTIKRAGALRGGAGAGGQLSFVEMPKHILRQMHYGFCFKSLITAPAWTPLLPLAFVQCALSSLI